MRDLKRRSKTKNGVFRSGFFDRKKIYEMKVELNGRSLLDRKKAISIRGVESRLQ